MGNLMSLYTSLNGRIGRKGWWLGTIVLAVVILIVEFVILTPLGLGPTPNLAAIQGGDAAAASAAISDSIHRASWIGLIIYVIFGFPIVALGVKRRHDKDNSGMDVMIFYAVALIISLVGALGIGYTTMDAGNGVTFPAPSMPLTIINVLFGIYAIYLLVVLGFLKGTAGSNQYGPDPLMAGATAAA
jgi:uncharacterized membrane protein YhaH (DUF805 family)